MAIKQKHNNRYSGLQVELPFKLPLNSLYYCEDTKNIYIYNTNDDPELIFDGSGNGVTYPLNTDLPIVGGTSDIDPISLMLSTDSGNIASFGTDGGLFVNETNTSIVEDVNGVQTYTSEDGTQYEIKKGYDLPAPHWEIIKGDVGITLTDGSFIYGLNAKARVPYIDQSLIDNGQVYVEYGRLKPRYQRGSGQGYRATETRIGFYSPRVNQTVVTGRAYSGGTHNNTTQIDRPNMFQINKQGFLAPELPRGAFYRMVNARYFNGDINPANNMYFTFQTPHMTGGKIQKLATNVLNVISNGNRRTLKNTLRDVTHQGSEWYARLVVIKDGKVMQQGPISEPLFIEFEGDVSWDERERVYKQYGWNWKAKLTIGHKFKK